MPSESAWDRKTSIILKDLIYHDFIHFVHPDNVLSLFVSKMHVTKVLCDIDISRIRAKMSTDGPLVASGFLLDCLSLYFPNWFDVLQDVLRDPSVRQNDLADGFDKYLDKAYSIRLEETVAHARPNAQTGHGDSFFRENSTDQPTSSQPTSSSINMPIKKGTQDDFSLDADQAESSCDDDAPECDYSDSLVSDMPKSVDPERIARIQARPLPPDPPADAQYDDIGVEPTPAKPSPEDTLIKPTQILSLNKPGPPPLPKGTPEGGKAPVAPLNPSGQDGYESIEYGSAGSVRGDPIGDSGYLTVRESRSSDYGGGARPKTGAQGASPMYENTHRQSAGDYGSKSQPPSYHRGSSDDKKKLISEFSLAETEAALSKFKGWCKTQTDRVVIQTFRSILDAKQDGHYLLWYWEKKKRPAICVSHKGKLITFIIHRRRDKSDMSKNIYYVDRKVSKPTLEELFQYHLENGLPNMKSGLGSDEKIKLTHAI